jgi:AcrR family transcriptional regulator
MRTQDPRLSQTQATILDSAIELFIADGFEKTSMEAIASAAGVAKGTLYYHFDSKEGIVDAVIERYAVSAESALDSIERDRTLDFVSKLTALVAAMEELNTAVFSKLHRMRYIDIHDRTEAVIVDRIAPFFGRVIEEGIRQGSCHVEHPLEYAEILLSSAQVLLDPERGVENYPRRIAAFTALSSRVLGLDRTLSAEVFRALEQHTETSDPSRLVSRTEE